MDIVYVVRPGDNNEELRYSLRTLSNIDHDKVWVVGYKPCWVTNVGYIEGNNRGEAWLNANGNHEIIASCKHISREFVFMNDDFFFLKQVDYEYLKDSSHHWRFSLKEHVDKTRKRGPKRYYLALNNTLEALRSMGHENPVAFTLHTPMLIDRVVLSEAINTAPLNKEIPYEMRSLYGNFAGLYRGPEDRRRDYKYYSGRGGTLIDRHFASTDDHSFKRTKAAKQIRSMFPEPSSYELT